MRKLTLHRLVNKRGYQFGFAALLSMASTQVQADEPWLRVSEAKLSASAKDGFQANTQTVAGRPQQAAIVQPGPDGFTFAELNANQPSVRAGMNATPIEGSRHTAEASLTYYLEFSDKPGTQFLTYNVKGAIKQAFDVAMAPDYSTRTGNFSIRSFSSVTISPYGISAFDPAYSLRMMTDFSVSSGVGLPTFSARSIFDVEGGAGGYLVDSLAFDTGTAGIMTGADQRTFMSGDYYAEHRSVTYPASFESVAVVMLNEAGYGFIQVRINASSTSMDGSPLHGTYTASSFTDPIFTIDAAYLADHPEATLRVFDGYGNSAAAVPEPSTLLMLCAGLIGVAGAYRRRATCTRQFNGYGDARRRDGVGAGRMRPPLSS